MVAPPPLDEDDRHFSLPLEAAALAPPRTPIMVGIGCGCEMRQKAKSKQCSMLADSGPGSPDSARSKNLLLQAARCSIRVRWLWLSVAVEPKSAM